MKAMNKKHRAVHPRRRLDMSFVSLVKPGYEDLPRGFVRLMSPSAAASPPPTPFVLAAGKGHLASAALLGGHCLFHFGIIVLFWKWESISWS